MKYKAIAVAAAVLLPALAGQANASEPALADLIKEGRETVAARYMNFQNALDDGYEQLFECTDHGVEGAMGQHYIHPGRTGDKALVLSEPDVLIYEPQADGSMQLVGVEYVVFEKDWNGDEPPVFLGQRLKRKTSVGKNPVDPFYEVHLWHWRHNPAGFFADWNTNVTCEHAQH